MGEVRYGGVILGVNIRDLRRDLGYHGFPPLARCPTHPWGEISRRLVAAVRQCSLVCMVRQEEEGGRSVSVMLYHGLGWQRAMDMGVATA